MVIAIPVAGAALHFRGMTDLGIGRGFDLAFNVVDKSADLYLCLGRADNRVRINGTTPLPCQASVLAAID